MKFFGKFTPRNRKMSVEFFFLVEIGRNEAFYFFNYQSKSNKFFFLRYDITRNSPSKYRKTLKIFHDNKIFTTFNAKQHCKTTAVNENKKLRGKLLQYITIILYITLSWLCYWLHPKTTFFVKLLKASFRNHHLNRNRL